MTASINGIRSGDKCLTIERDAVCHIFEKPLEPSDLGSKYLKVEAIIGIVNVESSNYLCVVTEKTVVAKLECQEIYEISKVKILPFDPSH